MLFGLIFKELPYLIIGTLNEHLYYVGLGNWLNLFIGASLLSLSLRDISQAYWEDKTNEVPDKNNSA